MALVVSVLENAIKAAMQSAEGAPDIPTAQQILSQQLAAAIDAYIKAGTVTVTVATTGGPTAQTGTGTGSVS